MIGRPICYVASPIDRLGEAPPLVRRQVAQWRSQLEDVLAEEGWTGYWPNRAFNRQTFIGDTAQAINDAAIMHAQGMAVLWPEGVDSAGIPAEIILWKSRGLRSPVFVQRGFDRLEIIEYLREQRADTELDRRAREADPVLKVKQLHPDAMLPTQAHDDDAGWDLYACEDVEIGLGETVDVPFGIAIEPPPGHWVRIIGRSSTARKRGLDVIEAVIDYGYRGPLYASTRNLMVAGDDGPLSTTVRKGERIAQAILVKSEPVDLAWAEELAPSKRGEQGFGSSGA